MPRRAFFVERLLLVAFVGLGHPDADRDIVSAVLAIRYVSIRADL